MIDQAAFFDDAPENYEAHSARSLLDQLLLDSQLYKQSTSYQELLDFVVRLRNFAPFNAMLLQIQKPGLRFAASRYDWWERFKRRPKEGARPLLILWPFGPVALVYDLLDTDGDDPLPQDVASCFFAEGEIDARRVTAILARLDRKHIRCTLVDAGDAKAGQIRIVARPTEKTGPTNYGIQVNQNHHPATQFATVAHELAHLFLGHLGQDAKLKIAARAKLTHEQEELEAESVAYIVCQRNGVKPKSESYLSKFVNEKMTADDLEVYAIMRAADRVESLLDLAAHMRIPRTGHRNQKEQKHNLPG